MVEIIDIRTLLRTSVDDPVSEMPPGAEIAPAVNGRHFVACPSCHSTYFHIEVIDGGQKITCGFPPCREVVAEFIPEG